MKNLLTPVHSADEIMTFIPFILIKFKKCKTLFLKSYILLCTEKTLKLSHPLIHILPMTLTYFSYWYLTQKLKKTDLALTNL